MLYYALLLLALYLDSTNAIGYVHFKLPFNWSYSGPTGPDNWCNLGYNDCCGKRQSPINLTPKLLQRVENKLQMTNYDAVPKAIHIENIADTVKLTFITSRVPTLRLENDANSYIFGNMHFHWGSSNNVGSEHTMDGKHQAMEGHIVHFNSKYSNSDEASLHPNGIVVLATFYKISKKDNPHLAKFIRDLRHVRYAETHYNDTSPFSASKLLPDLYGGTPYYTYDGSLTTPPCSQTVKWVVLQQPVFISETQIRAFRELQTRPRRYDVFSNHPLVNNYRPVQALNSRPVVWSELPLSWN